MRALPIAQYPEIAPPVVTVTRRLSRARRAETLGTDGGRADRERDQRRREHDLHELDVDRRTASCTIQVTFDIGTDLDQAALNVNNRVKQAEPRLPQEVRRQGVTVEKGSSSFLQVLAFYSARRTLRRPLHISNYVTLNVLDELKRVPGTTNVQIFGAKDYAMRIWLRAGPARAAQAHDRRRGRARSTSRTRSSPPASSASRRPAAAQELVYTITTQGRLSEPEQFENIIVRAERRRLVLRLKDVARVELGSKDYDFIGRVNGKPATLVGIFLQPGANALDGGEGRQRHASQSLPSASPGASPTRSSYDTTRFVEVSIEEVVKTLVEAMVLVFAGGLPVPAELARDADPARRGAGVADRHVRRAARCSATRSTR